MSGTFVDLFTNFFPRHCQKDGGFTCPQCDSPIQMKTDHAICSNTKCRTPRQKWQRWGAVDYHMLARGGSGVAAKRELAKLSEQSMTTTDQPRPPENPHPEPARTYDPPPTPVEETAKQDLQSDKDNPPVEAAPFCASATMEHLEPDLEQAKKFLALMTGHENSIITIQTFDDDRERKEARQRGEKDPYAQVIHGTIDDFAGRLTILNRQRAGIYWTVNETDLKGRTKDNVVKVRGFFVDLDGVPLDPVKNCALPPHVIVESSPGRYHGYWRVADCPLDKFEPVQKALIKKFNADRSCSDLSRVLRLSGFYHQKTDTPFMTRIVEIRQGDSYTVSDIVAGLQLMDLMSQSSTKKEGASVHNKRDFSDLLSGKPAGERDDEIFRYACSRRARGMSQAETETLVLAAARNCSPPFPENEALRKVDQAYKYPGPEQTGIEEARERIKGLIAQPDSLPKKVFDVENIGALALVRQEDPALWTEFKRGAKGLVKDVEKQIRKTRLSVVRTGEDSLAQTVGAVLAPLGITPPAGAEHLLLPAKYVFDDQGTGYLEHTEDGPRRRAVAPAYLLITKKMDDLATGEVALNLAFFTPAGWKTITVPRGDAVVSRRCVDLADKGYLVASHNVSEVARYHFEFENANQDTIVTQQISSALGWIEQKDQLSFMWGHQQLTGGEQAGIITFKGADIGDEQIADGYRQAGTFDAWISAIEQVKVYPHVILGIYASLSAPVLRIVDASNCGIDYTCKTSTGKTTLIRGAASAWGHPDEAGLDSCIHTWDQTPVAVERICSVASDLPFFLDDSKRIKRPEHISPILYSVISGQGRGRGSLKGLRRTRTWKTMLISTGEASAVSYSQDAGIRARIITVRGLPFGKEDQETAAIVSALDSAVKSNYGHAGPMFVQWLLENQDRWKDFQRQYSELRTNYQGVSGPASRIGAMVGVIVLTGQLVHEALSLPWSFQNPFDSLWTSIEADLENVHLDIRAIHDVISWAWSNEESFFGRHEVRVFHDSMGDPVDTHEKTPLRGWSGRWDRGPDWTFIGFYPPVLKGALEQMGYKDHDAIVSGWRERGWLNADPKKNTRVMRIGHESKRLLVIRREALPDMASDQENEETDADL